MEDWSPSLGSKKEVKQFPQLMTSLHKNLASTQRARIHGSFSFLGITYLNAGCPVSSCHLQLIQEVLYGILCQQIYQSSLLTMHKCSASSICRQEKYATHENTDVFFLEVQ